VHPHFSSRHSTTASNNHHGLNQKNHSEPDLHHYTELELSPLGVRWAGHITNPHLQCQGISHVLIGMRVTNEMM
jgi:hypothetical protein